jgi:hypothetical protein
MAKKTVFNKLWLDTMLHPEFAGWLSEKASSPGEAFCKVCLMSINLSNMGRRSLLSHADNSRHQKYNRSISQQKLVNFVKTDPGSQTVVSCAVGQQNSAQPMSAAAGDVRQEFGTSVISSTAEDDKPPLQQVKCTAMGSYVKADDVTKAEMLWAIKCIMSHFSFNSSNDLKDIFQLMFPDSSIVKKMSIGRTKLAYTITYGLAPYFHSQLLHKITKCQKIVVCFDEAFNRVSQHGQLDIIFRYWNDDTNTVSSSYFGSAFMGFASAKHVLESFKEAMAEVPLNKIMQISMDGPAVNWKFIDLLNADEQFTAQLLDLGSCGLHTVNGAFQTGHKVSGWQVNGYLRDIYNLFKDSPARRAAYTEITGNNVFPKKFCQIRWVENVSCGERALEVLPHIKKYAENKPNLPTSITSTTVKEKCVVINWQQQSWRSLSLSLHSLNLTCENTKQPHQWHHSYTKTLQTYFVV